MSWALGCSTEVLYKSRGHNTQRVEMGETEALVRTRSETYICDLYI